MNSRNSYLVRSAIIVAFILYSLLLIRINSFEVNGVRHYVLMDDEMISMQYARNLASGNGLVWNAGGERVEGISNLLWTGIMTVPHLLSVDNAETSLVIQLFEILILAANLIAVSLLATELSGSRIAGAVAGLLTGFCYPLLRWCVVCGTEAGPIALCITLASLMLTRELRNGRSSVTPFFLLAICTLLRIDMIVFSVTALLIITALDKEHRSKRLLQGGAILLLAIAAQTLFRLQYYGDPLPNTYYLKMTGFPILARMGRGLASLVVMLTPVNWVILAVPTIFVIKRREPAVHLLSAMIGVQLLYSIYVGGDAWEYYGGFNRFIAVVVPLLIVLFACGMIAFLRAAKEAGWGRLLVVGTGIGLTAIALFAMNYGQGMLREALLRKPSPFTPLNKRNVQWAQRANAITGPTARLAVYSAGVIPYFSDRVCIDLLGKNDARIAHEDMHIIPGSTWWGFHTGYFLPGHLKWDYAYSIGELKPDVIVGNIENEEAKPYLRIYRKEEELFVRDMER